MRQCSQRPAPALNARGKGKKEATKLSNRGSGRFKVPVVLSVVQGHTVCGTEFIIIFDKFEFLQIRCSLEGAQFYARCIDARFKFNKGVCRETLSPEVAMHADGASFLRRFCNHDVDRCEFCCGYAARDECPSSIRGARNVRRGTGEGGLRPWIHKSGSRRMGRVVEEPRRCVGKNQSVHGFIADARNMLYENKRKNSLTFGQSSDSWKTRQVRGAILYLG